MASKSQTEPAAGSGPGMTGGAGGTIFIYRGFNYLFLGSLFSKLADRLYQMSMVAAANVVFSGSKPENQLVYIQIVATVPLVFAYMALGTLIDAVDRRKLMYGLTALKLLAVFAFVPLLWSVQQETAPEAVKFVRDHWVWGLGIVFVLSLLDAPFGPARAAAVPDVVPQDQFRLGASLMATSGLISLLLGSLIGGVLAQTRHLGPAITILAAAGCYAFAAALLIFLPDAVAVPGRLRKKAQPQTDAPQPSSSGLLRQLSEGVRYCLRTRGIPQLVFFETAFWCLGSVFYFLFAWHLDFTLHLRDDNRTEGLALVLGSAGIGLFFGAVGAGRLSRRVSPIATYPAAFLIMAAGVFLMFNSGGSIAKTAGAQAAFVQGDWVEAALPGQPLCMGRIDMGGKPVKGAGVLEVRLVSGANCAAALDTVPVPRAQLVLLEGSLGGGLLAYVLAAGLLVGLGGGLMLGRVDADVLSIADEQFRGRVFTVKAVAFTAAILGTMGPLTFADDPVKVTLAAWFGPVLLILMLPAIVLAWQVDLAVWAEKGDSEPPGRLHRFGYALARFASYCLLKIFFRYEITGRENIPAQGKCILVANHASFLDPLFLGCASSRIVQWTMYASYYRSFAHPVFRFLRCIAVDEKSTLAALKANVRSLEQGACMGIFPEGQVSHNGQLNPPQHGALFLAQRSGAPVVPVALKGNYEALPRTAKFPRFTKVRAIVLPAFTVPKDFSREQVGELAGKMMADLARVLELSPPSQQPQPAKRE